jgi:uncharacterized protein YeaO (DUF488 family)
MLLVAMKQTVLCMIRRDPIDRAGNEGTRFLGDRIWPRGTKKAERDLDG